MSQKIENIKLKDLVLWTENPRDPIDANAEDQDIVNRALEDPLNKWNLAKLANEMGGYYDFSELPTVVFHGKKPVVYDGNRRIVLGKIKHRLVKAGMDLGVTIPSFPEEIPCNVCSEEIAIKNVYRKHADSGSWGPLERDIFVNKHMREKKSALLIIEENTGLISANPHLNQRFVKEEVLNEESLKKIGFTTTDNKFQSKHSEDQARKILADLSEKVKSKKITTRNNRGNVLGVLDSENKKVVNTNKNKHLHVTTLSVDSDSGKQQRQSARIKSKIFFFGETLYLKKGSVNDLYRDIDELYKYYEANKNKLSSSFPALIRMSLRLLCEAAAGDRNKMKKYLTDNFSNAKNTLSQDIKTTLSNYSVTEGSMLKLLQTGAHNYQASADINQTMALSIILGAMLKITHKK